MNVHRIFDPRKLGLAAAAAMMAGLATTGVAAASPPAAPSASVANLTLTITGTRADDLVGVSTDAATGGIQVDFGIDGSVEQTFVRNTFTAITALLDDGNDTFTVAPGTFADGFTMVDGGGGDDTIQTGFGIDLVFGGAGNDTIVTGPADDVIDAGRGNDSVAGGRDRDTAFLGAGQDSFLWNPGDFSDSVDGGGGTDQLDFNGSSVSETMSLSPNGSRAVFLRNVANIRMDLDGVEALNLQALGGADTVIVDDMRGTAVDRASIDLSSGGGGDAQPDVVTVNGSDRAEHVRVDAVSTEVAVSGFRTVTQITGSEINNDQLQVNSLGGNDTIDVTPAADALIGVTFDLGTGQR